LVTEGKSVSKHHVASLAFIVLLSSLLLATSVKGEIGPIFNEEIRSTFPPTSINGSVAPVGSIYPYVAGYMTDDYLSGDPGRVPGGAAAVCVTASFAGTDGSVIQSDNFLASGIAAQGPDTRGGWLPPVRVDWGYLLLLVCEGVEDDPYILGEVWEAFEWGRNGLWPLESPVADLVSHWTWSYPGILTIGSSVRLKMEWGPSHLNYYATIGGVEYNLHSYAAEETQYHYFMLGTTDRRWGSTSMEGTVKWFQFPGAWSKYNIGNTGWRSHLKNPSYRMVGESFWRSVGFAYSVHGEDSWLDNTAVWGGGSYSGVNAHYILEPWNLPPKEVIFYPTSDGSTIPIDTLFWDPYASSGGGPGGGECPTLFIWNGTDYASEGVLDIHAESDITVRHEIQSTLALENEVYRLELRELDNYTSHLDQVKLYAVDVQGEWHLSPLVYASHSELGWVTWRLRFDDETRVDLTPTQSIELRFLPLFPYSETAYFVFETNGHNRKALY
jgi:hypothetical protein